ncbi:MAG: hypothetical protein IRY95_07270, partial [Clostridia bacterium]|nr:hypothetical protein [Clostridia bacterium]
MDLDDAALRTAIQAAEAAARLAGAVIRRRAGTAGTVRTKRTPADLVTEVDTAAQEILRQELGRAFPEWGFVGEEGEGATPAPSVPAPSVPAPSAPAPVSYTH